MAVPGSFAGLLRHHRRAAGLTQEELAERADLSTRGLAYLESGRQRAPHRSTVRRLAAALRLDREREAALQDAARGPAAGDEPGASHARSEERRVGKEW